MPITIQCTCGKTLAASEAEAGLKGVCPNCGKPLIVPGDTRASASSGDVPFMTKSRVNKINAWIRRQQRVLWILALAAGAAAIVIVVGPIIAHWNDPPPSRPPMEGLSDLPEIPAERLPPDSPPWALSFEKFATAVASNSSSEKNLERMFTGKEVQWEITFHEINDNLLAFTEAEPLHKLKPAIESYVIVRDTQMSRANSLEPGDVITIRGRMGHPSFAKTTRHPEGMFLIGPADAVIEAVRRPN